MAISGGAGIQSCGFWLQSRCVMVHFMCHLGWVRDTQMTGNTLLLVFVRVFPEDVSIWISRRSKEYLSYQCGQVSSNPLRAWMETKGGGRANSLSLLELGHPFFFLRLDFRAPGSETFRLWLNHTTDIPGSLPCRQNIMGLPGLCNYMNWFS